MTAHLLTYNAWRGYRLAAFPAASWAVEGDVLHALPGGPPVSLITREPYGDFDLTLEWRLPEAGNSGILYRVSEADPHPWQSGPEMQLLDNARHEDGRVPETSCGALYGLAAPSDVPPCPAGVFNTARIYAAGTRVMHWLNGVRVLSCDLASAEFRARRASSKFRDLPRYARAGHGHIVLQHHGTEAWFRNIRIEAIVQARAG